jgi:hypothetical protein
MESAHWIDLADLDLGPFGFSEILWLVCLVEKYL